MMPSYTANDPAVRTNFMPAMVHLWANAAIHWISFSSDVAAEPSFSEYFLLTENSNNCSKKNK